MSKTFISSILICITSFIDLTGVILIVNLFLNLKPISIKIILFIIGGICFTGIFILSLTMKKLELSIIKKITEILIICTIVIFILGSIFSEYKIESLGVKRGTELYDELSFPSLIPLISAIMLVIWDYINV